MIALSVDSLGEVAGRVSHRRPPVEFDVLTKHVQGAFVGAEEATASQTSLLSEFMLETWYLCMRGRPQVQSMFIDL